MTRKPSEKEQWQTVAGALDAETLYRRYLRIRAERDNSREEADQTVPEIKKVNRGDILS